MPIKCEAEVIRVTLKPKPRLRNLVLEKDFSEIAIKGRQAQGNILTKNDVHRIALKQKGGSTLGGRKVWFDRDVMRLNYDDRGDFLGEFSNGDLVLVITTDGNYRTTNFDLSNHFESNILTVKKYNPDKVWTVALWDANQNYYYLKRFQLEPSDKPQSFLGDNPDSKLMLISGKTYPRIEVIFGGADAYREVLEIDAEEFISVKGFKARGKRLTTYEVEAVNELEPIRFKPEKEPKEQEEDKESEESENIEEKSADIKTKKTSAADTETDEKIDQKRLIDDITGQMTLFD